jgi:hypothetical protein
MMHKIVEFLIERVSLLWDFLVYLFDQVVDDSHYEVIVVATFPQLKAIAINGIEEEIVFQGTKIIGLIYFRLKGIVEGLYFHHGIFGEEVRCYSFLHVLVDYPDISCIQPIVVVESDVADDVFGAEDIDLLEAHRVSLKIKESC